jgi:anti-sigma factor RsiW
MNCREFRRKYSSYRDGHDPALAAEMDDHLEVCPDCAALDRAVRNGVDTLRGEELAPSPEFMERLAARLASTEAVPEPLPPRVSPWTATAAAALFLALVSLTVREIAVMPTPVAAAETPMVVAQPHLVPGIPFVVFDRIQPGEGLVR